MKVTVRITKNFKTEVKPLLKKYPSLSDDLLKLENELKQNPTLGAELGGSAYKIRLRIKSKGKGKSGGARVITYVENVLIAHFEHGTNEIVVNLISIYDKADTATINDSELRKLIDLYRGQ